MAPAPAKICSRAHYLVLRKSRPRIERYLLILYLQPTDKDVARTDRLNVFYSEANHSNVKKLYDVLLTYCMYNFDLGKLKKHVLSRNAPLSVILLQIVMVSPATHLMKNHESLPKTVYYSLLKLKYSPSIYLKHKKD